MYLSSMLPMGPNMTAEGWKCVCVVAVDPFASWEARDGVCIFWAFDPILYSIEHVCNYSGEGTEEWLAFCPTHSECQRNGNEGCLFGW